MADLDVIVPVYNEAESVDELVARVDKALAPENIAYNLIFVDDRSTDETKEKVKKHLTNHHHQNGNGQPTNSHNYGNIIYTASGINGEATNGRTSGSTVKLIKKKGKQGKAYSILEGAAAGNAPYIAMIDGDLQYPPEALPQLYQLARQSGVAVANRKNHQTNTWRKVGSKANRFLLEKAILGLNCDIQSGLKVFKREVIDNLDKTDVTAWTLDAPLLTTAQALGHKIESVDIDFGKRESGKSNVDFVKTAAEITKSAVKLKLKRERSHKIKPENGDLAIGAGITYKGKRFITHSHLPQEQSAIQTLIPWQKTALYTLLALFALGLLVNATATAILVISVLTLVYFADLVFSFGLLVKSLNNPPDIKIESEAIKKLKDSKLPVYTILCPLYKEANVVPQFLKAIEALSWPEDKLDVILLLEEDDRETLEAVWQAEPLGYIRTLVVPHSYPKTKPKACNYGLAHAQGELVVIYDAEDKPDPLQLKKAYLAFKTLPADVVCLQSKLNYYNVNQNVLTRLFTSEYSLWFDIILPGLQSIETTIPLGGTSNHFKTHALRFLHGWDAFNVTEDCDLGTRLFKAGFKTAIIDSTTLEEANSRIMSWLKQRSRWIKGYLQTYLVHMRYPIKFYQRHGVHSLIFSLVIGARMIFILVNPLLWATTISYFVARPIVGSLIESLYPAPIFYLAIISLVFGNFLYFYNFMIGVAKRHNWEIMKYVFFIPFYWALTSVSAVIAFYQLVVAPHYWEKTEHGLIRQKAPALLPELQVSLSFDFEFPTQVIKRLLSGFFWPIALVVKNAIDLIGLFEPWEVDTQPERGKLRVLIFNWRDTKHVWAGGAEAYVHELARKWVDKGHQVTLFCGWDGQSARDEIVDGVKIIRRGGFYTVYPLATFYYLLKFRGKFDVVIDSENGIPFFTPLFVGIPRILLIHHVHQQVFTKYLRPPFSNLARFLESKAMPYFYQNPDIVTVSNSSKDDIVLRGWTEERNIEIVTPGIDTEKFGKARKTNYPSFVYLGRLKPYKNIDLLIKAFAQIYPHYPEARLAIAGFGESLYSLKRLAKRLKVADTVSFLGRVSDEERGKLFAQSWAAVQPSSIEGWGFTVIEANASATPVIASKVKGLRDSVVDGQTGILFPPNDLAKLTQAMLTVITNLELRNKLSENALQWSKCFDWRQAAAKFESIMQSKVAERQLTRRAPKVAEAQVI